MGETQKIMQVRSARQVPVRVTLLDDDVFNHSVDKRAKGWILFDKVCEHLNILEKSYFGLNFYDAAGEKYWLNIDKKIAKQLKGQNWDFNFEVKFYPADPSQLSEDLTRYQLCLQIRRDIVNERLPCSFVTYTLLGSYTAQSELGDYDTEEFGSGYRYLKEIQFAPHQDKELLMKIAELHRQHKGQSPEEAEIHFLENAKKLAMFGVELHPAKDAEGRDIQIGVCASGLIVYKDKQQVNRFVWPKVLKISYRRNKYYIKIRPGEFEEFASLIGFKLSSSKFAKRLWKISVEYHSFFRFKEAEFQKHTSFLPRFGSRFRYSGRTQFQTRQAVAEENRDAPYFDRVLSKRGTFSGRTDNMRKRDEERQKRRDEMRQQPIQPQTRLPPSESPSKPPPEPKRTPPEPKHAPPVAPKPKPIARGPPSVDDNHSDREHTGSLNDSFDDVPDRRSKMEKIHAVATPLAALMQSKKEHEVHVEEHRREEESHKEERDHRRDRRDDHRDDRESDHDDRERSFEHEVGKTSQTNPTNSAYKSDNIRKGNGDRSNRIRKSKSTGDNSSRGKNYVFSYPTSSYESVTSHGDYNTCNDSLSDLNSTTGSVQNLAKQPNPGQTFVCDPLSHSVSAEIVYSEIPKSHYEEIGPKSEGIYAEIDEVKSQVNKLRATYSQRGHYAEVIDEDDRQSKQLPDAKIYGRRSKRFKSNQTSLDKTETSENNIDFEKDEGKLDISKVGPKSKTADKSDAKGSRLSVKQTALQMPVYAKINKQNKMGKDDLTQNRTSKDHPVAKSLNTSEPSRKGSETIDSLSSSEGSKLKEELKMYILTPEKLNARNSLSKDNQKSARPDSLNIFPQNQANGSFHRSPRSFNVASEQPSQNSSAKSSNSELLPNVATHSPDSLDHCSNEISPKVQWFVNAPDSTDAVQAKTEPVTLQCKNETLEVSDIERKLSEPEISEEAPVKVLSLSSLEDAESVHNISSVISEPDQVLISDFETEEIELDMNKRFGSNSLSSLYKLTFDGVSNNGTDSLKLGDEDLERFSTVSSDSGEQDWTGSKSKRDIETLESRVSELDDQLERFTTISTDSSELGVGDNQQSLQNSVIFPSNSMKSKTKSQPNTSTLNSEKIPENYIKDTRICEIDDKSFENCSIATVVDNQTAGSAKEDKTLRENQYNSNNAVSDFKSIKKAPSFEIENFEEEPYSRTRFRPNTSQAAVNNDKGKSEVPDDVEMDFFKKPILTSDFGLKEMKTDDDSSDKGDAVISGNLKCNHKASLLKNNFENKVVTCEVEEVQKLPDQQGDTEDVETEAGVNAETQNKDDETPSKVSEDQGNKSFDPERVRKRLVFVPSSESSQSNATVPIIKGSKVFGKIDSDDVDADVKIDKGVSQSPVEERFFMKNEEDVKREIKFSEPSRAISLSSTSPSSKEVKPVVSKILQLGEGPSVSVGKSYKLDNTILLENKLPDARKEATESHPAAEINLVLHSASNKLQEKENKKSPIPFLIKGSKVFLKEEENTLADSKSPSNETLESSQKKNAFEKRKMPYSRTKKTTENIENLKNMSTKSADDSFESNSSTASEISASSKQKKKVSPGIIHMINPKSGWIEGGLKSSHNVSVAKKPEKLPKYTVSVLDFHPKTLPSSTVTSMSCLDSDLTNTPENNPESDTKSDSSALDKHSFEGSDILERAKHADLLSKRVLKKYVKEGTIKIKEINAERKTRDETDKEELQSKPEAITEQNYPTSVKSAHEQFPRTSEKDFKDADLNITEDNSVNASKVPVLNNYAVDDTDSNETAFKIGDKLNNGVIESLQNEKVDIQKAVLEKVEDQSEPDLTQDNEEKLNLFSLKDEDNKILVPEHLEDQSLQSKLQALGLGNLNIDTEAIDQQRLESSKIDYNMEEESDSDSGPSDTDSESGDEIELASFEMPGFVVNSELDRNFVNSDSLANLEGTQQFAIDCSFENVKSYKMEEKTDHDGMSILCECNFPCPGRTGRQLCELHEPVIGRRNARDPFKPPEIIDESPHVPNRSNLKTKAKSEPSLSPRRVRFEENLPVYKSSGNISTMNKHMFSKKRKDPFEEQHMRYIEDFITCMFDEEPRNIGLNHTLPDTTTPPEFENDDNNLVTKSKDSDDIGLCSLDNQNKRSPKIVKPVSGKRSPLVTVSTQQCKSQEPPVVISNDWKTFDNTSPIQYLNSCSSETIENVPKILFTSPTGEITSPDGCEAGQDSSLYSENLFSPFVTMPVDEIDTNADVIKDGGDIKVDNPCKSNVPPYSSVCIAELKSDISTLDDDNSKDIKETDTADVQHTQNQAIKESFILNDTGVNDDTALTNGKSEMINIESQPFSTRSIKASEIGDIAPSTNVCSQAIALEMLNRLDSTHAETDGRVGIGTGKEIKPYKHTPGGREEVTRYTFSLNDDSDTECPKIKTVTYEYVTEYKLNNVKIQYQQNRKTQTDKAIGDVTDGDDKNDKFKYVSIKSAQKSGEKFEPLVKYDSKIIVEEVIEKSVCYPLGPSQNKPACEFNLKDQVDSDEEIEKSITVLKQSRPITKVDPGCSDKSNSHNRENVTNDEIDFSDKKFKPVGIKDQKNSGSPSLKNSKESPRVNDSKVIEHDSKKYLWNAYQTKIPFRDSDESQNMDSYEMEANCKRRWTLCDDLDGEEFCEIGNMETVEDIGRKSDDEDEKIEEKLQGKARLRQICQKKVLKRHEHVEETFPDDAENLDENEDESSGDIWSENGTVNNIDRNDMVTENFTVKASHNLDNSLIEVESRVNPTEDSNDGEMMYAALMQERLPEIDVQHQTNESLIVAQAVAIIALSTVLVFLLPYMG